MYTDSQRKKDAEALRLYRNRLRREDYQNKKSAERTLKFFATYDINTGARIDGKPDQRK